MNRVLKFRAWDRQEKKMIDWKKFEGEKLYRFLYNLRYIIMQFTGLKDKNEVEIYEGDVLRCSIKDFVHTDTIELGWNNNGEYGFYWSNKDNINGCGDIIRKQDEIEERYEVIGNIWENPELVGGKE